MSDEELIRELATRACCEALQETLQEKSRELAEDVARKMGAALTSPPAQPGQPARSRQLRDGSLLISNSRTQTEILESLLAAGSLLTPECGLLIVRGEQASGWSCLGFATPENFKGAPMDCTRGAVAAVLSSCAGRIAKASELDAAFAARFGLENSAEVLLLPVLLKERVAALLLALSGNPDDLAGLEVLVQVAQLALELQTYRRAAQTTAEAPYSAGAQRSTASQPSAGARTGFAAEPEFRVPAVAQPAPAAAQSYAAASAAVGYSTAGSAVAEPGVGSTSGQPAAPVLDETHERGRRFAKLLVEEIKLYNQTKVSEGRANRDLYSRLREEIEKSRAAYQKRYGESVRDADYFTQELMRILADNDATLMGAGFPG